MTRRVRLVVLATLIWAACFALGYFDTPRYTVLPPSSGRV